MRIIRKIIYKYLLLFYLISVNSYALPQENKLDIYTGVGYTVLENFSFNKTKKIFNKFKGLNLSISGFYVFNENEFLSPIVGTSFSAVNSYNSQNLLENSDIVSVNTFFRYFSFTMHGGIKIHPINSFQFYGFTNFGYSYKNDFIANFESSNSHVNLANDYINFIINDHYFYGITLMSSYKIIENFSLGANLIYNRHSINLNYITRPQSITEHSYFDEYSINLFIMWSY